MSPRKLIKLLNRVQMTVHEHYENTEGTPLEHITPPNSNVSEGWRVVLKYMGREMDSLYLAPKGMYEKPELIWVINSQMGVAFMWETYKNDYFRFMQHLGAQYKAKPERLRNLYEEMRQGVDALHDFFRDDFRDFYEHFLPLRDLEDHVKQAMELDDIIDFIAQWRKDKTGRTH